MQKTNAFSSRNTLKVTGPREFEITKYYQPPFNVVRENTTKTLYHALSDPHSEKDDKD